MERVLLPRASFHRQLAGVPPRRCSSAATVPSRHHLLLASNSSLHAPSSSATAHEFPHHHLRPRPPRFCSTHHLLASAPAATRNHFRPHLHQLESTFRFTAAARSSRSLHLTQQPWLHQFRYHQQHSNLHVAAAQLHASTTASSPENGSSRRHCILAAKV